LVAGGAVGFHFFALLPSGNDDIAGVPTSVDDGSKVTCGEVVEVTASLLVHLDGTVPTLGALRIDEPAMFLLDVKSSTLMLDEDSLSIVTSTSSSSGSRR
jgi:hypothetical protein